VAALTQKNFDYFKRADICLYIFVLYTANTPAKKEILMSTAQTQFTKKTAVAAMLFVSVFTASVFSQAMDTAYVPFRVNVDAVITARQERLTGPGTQLEPIIVTLNAQGRAGSGSGADTLKLPIEGSSSVWNNSAAHGHLNAPAMLSDSRGNISLRLPAQQYRNAEFALYSVNGKRVLRGKASVSADVNGVSRKNAAPGVYLMSVKGADGSAFTARLTHGGGNMNINVVFGGVSQDKQLGKSAAAGDWTIKVSAIVPPGSQEYEDSVYTLHPAVGRDNARQNITLRRNLDPGPGPNPGVSEIGCSRAGLEAAVNSYLAAMNAGDYTLMPLTSNAKYVENTHDASASMNRVVPFGQGLWATPIQHDRHMNLIDVDECAAFTEVIIATQTPKYLNGVRLKVTGNQISEVWLVVTQEGDWLFNAANYLKYAKEETEKTDWKHNWSEIPVEERLTREELRTAGNAYLEYFGDKTVKPMWGVPCSRLEGGAYTGSGSNSSCNVGVPDLGMKLGPFQNLVDVDKGMTVSIFNFGGADSHLFRIIKGHGYRYIHTLTAMKQSDFQGP